MGAGNGEGASNGDGEGAGNQKPTFDLNGPVAKPTSSGEPENEFEGFNVGMGDGELTGFVGINGEIVDLNTADTIEEKIWTTTSEGDKVWNTLPNAGSDDLVGASRN